MAKWIGRFFLALLLSLGALVVLGSVASSCTGGRADQGGSPSSHAYCGPLDRSALSLPADKRVYWDHFERQALMLQGRGQCVVEGSWGEQTGAFYIVVRGAGGPPRHVRFTPDELTR